MRITISLIIALLSLNTFSQSKSSIKAVSLIDPDLRLLYIGVENVIHLENNTDTNVFLQISEGGWFDPYWSNKAQPNVYHVKVSRKGPTTISIMKKTASDTLLLDTATFIMLRVPDPEAVFGNLIDTAATMNALMLQQEIKTFMPYYYDMRFRIISFTITVTRPDGTVESISACGNMISIQQQQIISGLKPGDIFWVEDIHATCPDCTTRTLAAIRIKVVAR